MGLVTLILTAIIMAIAFCIGLVPTLVFNLITPSYEQRPDSMSGAYGLLWTLLHIGWLFVLAGLATFLCN